MFRRLLLIIILIALASAASAMPTEEALVDELVRMYGLDTAWCEVTIEISRLRTREVEPGEIRLRAITQKEPVGLFTVAAEISRGGGRVESGQVRFRITRYAEALVAAEKIDMRQDLRPELFERRRVDVTDMFEATVGSVEQIAGFRSAKMLRKGTVLTTSCLEEPPDVESGRTVTILYVDGPCRIAASGTALQPGRAGDYVKVRNSSSGKIVLARVVDGGAVMIDP